MISTKADNKVISLKSKETGLLEVEILPCNIKGEFITEKDGIVIRDPKQDLLNKNINFVIKINELKNLPSNFEDVYCQFQVFNDKTVYKTQTVKGDKGFKFNFSKQFTFTANEEVLYFLKFEILFNFTLIFSRPV